MKKRWEIKPCPVCDNGYVILRVSGGVEIRCNGFCEHRVVAMDVETAINLWEQEPTSESILAGLRMLESNGIIATTKLETRSHYQAEQKPVGPEQKPVGPEQKPVGPEQKPVGPEQKPVGISITITGSKPDGGVVTITNIVNNHITLPWAASQLAHQFHDLCKS